jgi:hypothetical protein
MNWDTKWGLVKDAAQNVTHYVVDSRAYARIPWDGEGPCPDCGVEPLQLHVVGNNVTQGSPPPGFPLCSQDRCPHCGGQALSCPCQLSPYKGSAR